MALYIGVFLFIVTIVAVGYQPPQHSSAVASPLNSAQNTSSYEVSVDDLVATSMAANIAQTAGLPVANNVTSLSQSIAAESVLAQNEANIVSKPQIVQPTADTRKVRTYKTVTGDTVASVAAKYGLSPNTIRWANNLTSDALAPGRTLKILPTDGVLYTVRGGDTLASLAQRYSSNAENIKLYNDLELGGLSPGKQLIIPSGSLPETERPGYVAPRPQIATNNYSYSGGSATINTFARASVGNRYAFGNCTWYAYERRLELGRPVGSLWGNAATWAYYAGAAGYTVSGTPAVGSVMQNGGGYGHVAVVEAVNPGVSITISEMNMYRFGGGFNRIGRGNISWSEATSGMYRYIY